MSEHTLPEDLSRWPANPYLLLGVRPGVAERDLRRAYTRLIRTYKPEQYPEHFRRIREAYEAVQRYTSLLGTPKAPADAPPPPAESPPEPEAAPEIPEAADAGAPAAERPRLRPLEEELDEAWDWAVQGDEARAYSRLLELNDRHPARSDILLRLYGLLGAAPELDPRRTACDFLAEGLRRSGGSGPCHELYRREIEDDPAEALSERFARLLQATTQPGMLATFARWRWSAAGRLKRFGVISDDLPGLRARLAADHEEIWLRLLASAADRLAWAPGPARLTGLAQCLREAERLEHLHLRCADVFDRLERLEAVGAGWRAVRMKGKVPADLLDLLADFWAGPFPEVRRRVADLLAAVAAAPNVWLTHLDRVKAVSAPALALFGEMLKEYQQTLEPGADGRAAEDVEALARCFLEEHAGVKYTALRPRLLAFCLREWVDPEVIARLARSQVVELPQPRLQMLVNDGPLRHVYRACVLLSS